MEKSKSYQSLQSFTRSWLLPPKVNYALSDRWALIKSLNKRNVLEKNVSLKKIFKGKRCFVIGNGPSISTQNLSLLKGEITVVCNSFFRHEIIKEWQPTIFCSGDPASTASLSSHLLYYQDVFKYLNPLFYIFHYSVLEQLLNSSEIQIPHSQRNKILGFTNTILLRQVSDYYQIDFTKPIPAFWNTPMLSLMVAIYMGCNPIILIGCDHDYIYRIFRQDYRQVHFYQESDYSELPKFTYLEIANEITKRYGCYQKLNQIAINQGVTILDATNNGFLDTFEKVSYESLFVTSRT
jgi:hypothetical protein